MDHRDTFSGTPAPPPQAAPQAPTPTDRQRTDEIAAINPFTGEPLVDLHDDTIHPTDELANMVLEYRRQQADWKTWRGTIEAELRRRLGPRRRATVGNVELSLTGGKWDPDELEVAGQILKEQGVISDDECLALVVLKKVANGTLARRLFNNLEGAYRDTLEQAYVKGTHLNIDRVPDLADALPEGRP